MAVKVGLIGVSGYSSVHLGLLEPLIENGTAELLACVCINPDQVADKLEKLKAMGVKIYPSTEAMYAEWTGKLDLVCIPTGIAWHERMTVEALKHGANVLVEKPVTSSNESVARMIKAEEESNGKFVAVGFQHTYAREIQFIKQYLLSGRLGKIKQVVCSGVWPRNDAYYARNNWAGKLYAADGTPIWDSPINNAFAHYLNIELFLSGKAFDESAHVVAVEGNLYRARENIETFDTCALRFTTESGIEILTMLTHAGSEGTNVDIRLECEKGKVYWNSGDGWKIVSEDGKVLFSGICELPQTDMYQDVMQKVSGKQVFCCTLKVAGEHANCVDMLTRQITPIVIKETVTRLPENGQYVMDNINKVFEECNKQGKLPAEIGVVWK